MIFESYLALDVLCILVFKIKQMIKYTPEVLKWSSIYVLTWINFSCLLKIKQLHGFLEFFNFYDIFNQK